MLRSIVSNVPYIGNVVVEMMAYQSEQEALDHIDRRFQVLADAVAKLADLSNATEIEKLLSTHGYVTLQKKLADFYFNNGSDKFQACRVFLNAWKIGAFDELDLLSQQDRITILGYIFSQYYSYAIGRRGAEKLSQEEGRLLINLGTNFINSIDQTQVRYIDVSIVFILLGYIHSQLGSFKIGALCLIKGVENAIYEGVNFIPYSDQNASKGHSLESVFSGLGIAFLNMNMLDLARHALIVSTEMQETLNRSPGGPELDNAFWLGYLFGKHGDEKSAVRYYRKFLDLHNNNYDFEWLKQHEDNYLWGRREAATRYIMENEVPRPDKNQSCLCGLSDLPYSKCCSPEPDGA